MGLKMVDLQRQEIRDVMDDDKMERDEWRARLELLFQQNGQLHQLQALRENNDMRMLEIQAGLDRAAMQARNQTEALKQQVFWQQYNAHIARGDAPEKASEAALAESGISRVPASVTSKTLQQIEVTSTDAQGQPATKQYAAQQLAPGQWIDAATGNPIDTSGGIKILGRAGAGRQAATQITAMIGSANEVVPALRNLIELPITATTGVFMGVQTDRPDALGEAVKRSLASRLTSDESKAIMTRFAGISRAMATLEAQGRATGLVGLQRMNEGAVVPQEGDSGITIMGKYAEIRQVVEQNIETVMASPDIAPAQKQLLEKVRKEIKEAVPWTVHDVNQLIAGKGSEESVRAFAARVLGEKHGDATPSTPAGTPPPSPGDLVDGYIFKGGNPADPSNWTKAPEGAAPTR
jgi:hypothetical protein